MAEKIKARIMDEKRMTRAIRRLATEIIERNRDIENLVLVGIRTRGVFLAQRFQKLIEEFEGVKIPLGILDITLYRDDIPKKGLQPEVKKTEIPFSIEDKDLILVDDVLFTGRTVRAALDSLMDLGRPKTVQLAVLIDRGHRELPIQADYVGKVLPTSKRERVKVMFKEYDGKDEVLITEPEEEHGIF